MSMCVLSDQAQATLVLVDALRSKGRVRCLSLCLLSHKAQPAPGAHRARRPGHSARGVEAGVRRAQGPASPCPAARPPGVAAAPPVAHHRCLGTPLSSVPNAHPSGMHTAPGGASHQRPHTAPGSASHRRSHIWSAALTANCRMLASLQARRMLISRAKSASFIRAPMSPAVCGGRSGSGCE